MTVDRKLLWAAYPDGYLAMRGVSTVGGYLFEGTKLEDVTWYDERDDDRNASLEAARAKGDLLPNLDPADTATWGCALHELFMGVEQLADRHDPLSQAISDNESIVGYRFGLNIQLPGHMARIWHLWIYTETRTIEVMSFVVDAEKGTAPALAAARAQLRELSASSSTAPAKEKAS